ncbi:Probable peptide/nitrate transporter At3g43790 (Protein ZINC INDUCED FACILITATOR-LIKE 2) [Durusdinium trenchii]|uniref:Probable peptide/nitrate transporter At3g43790 (Protein ZINC INDUCED FACILITATOR-LIKE 2) n=1 Tax=Durusdinium trenchii TaxID=1381693 RepID=A0ABP0QPA3_9DINO
MAKSREGDVAEAPLPRWHLAFLCMMDSAHFYTVCSLFSYAGVLTADMKWTEDTNSAGFVAGYLQSANVCGRIVTSTFWGCVAQRYGPKPVLLCALFSILLGSILFGFCTNLAAAMGVRFLFLGVLNGWPALFGPCAAACAGDHRQTEVLGFILAAGSGMQLVGPSIGGWTYGWVPSFPAVLPSTIGCVLTVVPLRSARSSSPIDARIVQCAARSAFGSDQTLRGAPRRAPRARARPITSSTGELRDPVGVALALFARVHRAFGTSGASASAEGSVGSPSKSRGAQRSVLCQWPVPLVLWMRLCNGFALFGLFEATPLWLISDRELGGLGMSEKAVGSLLSRSALWSLIYFPYVLPTCTKRFGCRTCAALMSVIACGLAIALPFARSMPLVNVLHMLASSSFQSQAALNVSFTNNAAGTEGRALVTGVAVTCETLGKASAPVVMSYLFAGFLRHYGEAGHGLVFFIMAALSVMELLCTLCLPSSVEDAWEHERVPVEHDPVPAEKVLPAKIGLENPEMNALHRRVSE